MWPRITQLILKGTWDGKLCNPAHVQMDYKVEPNPVTVISGVQDILLMVDSPNDDDFYFTYCKEEEDQDEEDFPFMRKLSIRGLWPDNKDNLSNVTVTFQVAPNPVVNISAVTDDIPLELVSDGIGSISLTYIGADTGEEDADDLDYSGDSSDHDNEDEIHDYEEDGRETEFDEAADTNEHADPSDSEIAQYECFSPIEFDTAPRTPPRTPWGLEVIREEDEEQTLGAIHVEGPIEDYVQDLVETKIQTPAETPVLEPFDTDVPESVDSDVQAPAGTPCQKSAEFSILEPVSIYDQAPVEPAERKAVKLSIMQPVVIYDQAPVEPAEQKAVTLSIMQPVVIYDEAQVEPAEEEVLETVVPEPTDIDLLELAEDLNTEPLAIRILKRHEREDVVDVVNTPECRRISALASDLNVPTRLIEDYAIQARDIKSEKEWEEFDVEFWAKASEYIDQVVEEVPVQDFTETELVIELFGGEALDAEALDGGFFDILTSMCSFAAALIRRAPRLMGRLWATALYVFLVALVLGYVSEPFPSYPGGVKVYQPQVAEAAVGPVFLPPASAAVVYAPPVHETALPAATAVGRTVSLERVPCGTPWWELGLLDKVDRALGWAGPFCDPP